MAWDKIATFVGLIVVLAFGIWWTCFRKDKKNQ